MQKRPSNVQHASTQGMWMLYRHRAIAMTNDLWLYLVHWVVTHRPVVVRLGTVVAAVYSHPISRHVLGPTRWRWRHHRRGCALAGAAHAVRRCSCKSCCRNNRSAYKFRDAQCIKPTKDVFLFFFFSRDTEDICWS